MSRAWLQDLKLDQLHRLATLVGSNCSGTKAVRVQGIQDAVQSASALSRSLQPGNGSLKVVSVDMGIRNLAYCSIKTPFPNTASRQVDPIIIESWERVEVAPSQASRWSISKLKEAEKIAKFPKSTVVEVKESFEPQLYSRYAYNFIKKIIDEHGPSHVLIERQRFRSGGGSAVQEWTIRVGMFEAMLYATLRTLTEEGYCDCRVVPVVPAMVNRFWLNGASEETSDGKRRQRQSTQIKKQKIYIASKYIRSGLVDGAPISFSASASQTKDDFLARLEGQKSSSPSAMPKLDDLADSLLQGLAWITWQRNRLNLEDLSKREFGVS